MGQLTGLLGVGVLILIAVAISENRRRINWRIVGAGLALQMVMAFLLLKLEWTQNMFEGLAAGVTKVLSFSDAGSRFVFGDLIENKQPWFFVFAVQVLPTIIFFASLMAVLYHLRIMQVIVAGVAWVLRRWLGITGVESLSAAANIFLGQTEAPLTVRPYIAGMTRSQLAGIMVPGFASIAGGVMAAYIKFLGGPDEASQILFAKHLMIASLMSAPAGLMMAKIVVPETGSPSEESLRKMLDTPRTTVNVMDAAAEGATDGLKLALNVAAMLVAFVALLAMLDYPLTALSNAEWFKPTRESLGLPVLSLKNILGTVLGPLAWCIGVPWEDCRSVGSLMGTQVIATEFVAYMDLGQMREAGTISPRAVQIATYCLCGFANLPSIAIQIGGLSAMAPSRRGEFASLGLRAMTAGALACWSAGAVAGVFIG